MKRPILIHPVQWNNLISILKKLENNLDTNIDKILKILGCDPGNDIGDCDNAVDLLHNQNSDYNDPDYDNEWFLLFTGAVGRTIGWPSQVDICQACRDICSLTHEQRVELYHYTQN